MGRKLRLAYRKKKQEGCSSSLPVVSLPVVSLPAVSLPVVSLPVVTDAGNILNIYGYHRFVLLLIVSSLQFSST